MDDGGKRKKEEDDWVRCWVVETTINLIESIALTLLHWAIGKSERQEKGAKEGERYRHCSHRTKVFRDDNEELTIQQSTVLWFECINGVKEKRMSTRSIEIGRVEAEIWLTFPIVGRSRVCAFSICEEMRKEKSWQQVCISCSSST